MRKHIDTFKDKMLNESLLNDNFLITYQVINYKNIDNLDYTKSPIYSYIIKANSKDDAKNKFETKWETLANYRKIKQRIATRPKPKLEIISIEKIGEFSDKIHTN